VTPSTIRPDSRALDLRARAPGSAATADPQAPSTLLPPALIGTSEAIHQPLRDSLIERLRGGGPAFAWAEPGGREVFGFGAAARFEGSGPGRFRAARAWLGELARAARGEGEGPASSLIAVGGFSFAEGSAGAPAGFGDAAFFVPAEIVILDDKEARRTRWSRPGQDPSGSWSVTPWKRPSVTAWTEAEWLDGVRAVLEKIESGAVDKAVLARAVEIETPVAIDAGRVFDSLSRANPECFRFLVRPHGDTFVVGASPERLVAVRHPVVVSDAVAGTAADGALLESGKDRSEHAFVLRHIIEALEPLCTDVEADAEPSLQRHRHMAHLKTRVSGRVLSHSHVLDFVERVHPTPAVAGSPRGAALELIRALEPSHRGWYAGAVGWMTADGVGDFTVAIRSALVHERRALLFAGAGIVAGSDPASEWAETEIKLSVMREAIADAAG
jgi:salicylate biosynthesis isochorismate synthase